MGASMDPMGPTSAATDASDAVASAVSSAVASAVAPYETPGDQLIWLTLGDLELRVNAYSLRAFALSNLDGMLGQAGAGMFAIRGAAVALYPTLRKLMRQHAPMLPVPELPRGADPVRYLASWVADAALWWMVQHRWDAIYRERSDGSIELIGAREVAVVVDEAARPGAGRDVGQHPAGSQSGAGSASPLDTTDAKRAPRGAQSASARKR